MAKLNFNGVNFNSKGAADSKANKVERITVAIVNEKGVCLVTNGNDIAEVYQSEMSADSALEGFVSFMEDMVPVDTLLDKPFRVILPKSISGIVTGAYLDWVRTNKTISTGTEISADKMALYKKVIGMINERFMNMEVIADRHANKADKELVGKAWDSVRAIIKDMLSGKIATTASVSASPKLSKEDVDRIASLKAKKDAVEDQMIDADTEEEEAKLQKKIDKIMAAIARVYKAAGVAPEEEVVEESVEEEVASAVKGGVEF